MITHLATSASPPIQRSDSKAPSGSEIAESEPDDKAAEGEGRIASAGSGAVDRIDNGTCPGRDGKGDPPSLRLPAEPCGNDCVLYLFGQICSSRGSTG